MSGVSPGAELPDHPRIYLTEKGEAELKKRIARDPLAAKLHKNMIRYADEALKQPVCKYDIPDGKRLLAQSRHALSVILHCSLAWRLSEDEKYLDRAIREMDAACGLKDWNPSHFLDTAEMSTAVGIGYDWLYHDLKVEQRARYAKALREKGLKLAREGFTGKRAWWSTPRNNWGQVCSTGLLVAELALEKEGDEIHPARIEAAKTLDACREFYKPDGAYPEGPAYWHYGSNYHVMGLAALEGSHEELQVQTPPEFKMSAVFTEYLTGSSDVVFNFADAGPSRGQITAAQCWMARAFGDPGVVTRIRSKLDGKAAGGKHRSFGPGRFFPLGLIWLPEESAEMGGALPLDSKWGGTQPLVSMRTSWDDPDALFVAMKGGYPKASHGQMDIGAFVLDYDGIRWAQDLGSDNYNLPGYFGGKRWSYFRLTNHSHSTLVIGGKLQHADAKTAPLTEFKSTPEKGAAAFDISSAYEGQADRVIRSCVLDRKAGSVTVTDEIKGAKEDVRWAMTLVVNAEIEIDGKRVLLKKSGKQLEVMRNDDSGGQWSVQDATPKSEAERQNKGVKLLTFTAPAGKEMKLSVSFRRP